MKVADGAKEDYKIKVDNVAESVEAQELFFELGYGWQYGAVKEPRLFYLRYLYARFSLKAITHGSSKNRFIENEYMEITLPQLKDMVVLNRNDVGDAQYSDKDGFNIYISSDGKIYYFEHRQFNNGQYHTWVESCINNHRPESLKDEYISELKPIEKPMKEYLNADYDLITTAISPVCADWIEVPKGAVMLIKHPNGREVWSYSDSKVNPLNTILWQRKQPKELKFNNDGLTQPKTKVEEMIPIKLEYFDKFLRGEKVQYKLGAAVDNPDSQWNNLTYNALKNLKRDDIVFRTTPKYVTLNGIEFKTKDSLLKHIDNNYDLEG